MKELEMVQKIRQRYIEIGFFGSYFIVLPIITWLQYANYFNQSVLASIVYYTLSGIVSILTYLIYYRFILPNFLFSRKYFFYFLTLIAFVFFSAETFHMSNVLINKLLSGMTYLPKQIRSVALPAAGLSPLQSISFSITVYNLISLTSLGYIIKTLNEEQLQNQVKQNQLNLELDALKAQLHPHFFFNTLNSIYSQALQSSKDTSTSVAKLSDLMRYILYECDKNLVTLKQEIKFIRNYIELEQLRHDDVYISLDLQGKTENLSICPFLLIPLIENAFKHGIDDNISHSSLSIIISVVDNELTAIVKNSKHPVIHSNNKQLGGIGLRNLRKRLNLLYPERFSLNFFETDNDFEACLTLTIK
ncbi:MAG: sensor histidine kinase [Chitinophagaceae bacterium]